MVIFSQISLQKSAQHPHYLWCDGVACTVLSSNERLFMFMRETSCWARFKRSNISKANGSFLDKILVSAAFSTGSSWCPGIGCADLSNRTWFHLVKVSLSYVYLSKIENSYLISIWFPIFRKTQFPCWVFLVLVTHPVLDYHIVAIQSEWPTTNITLVHWVSLQPG